MERAVPAPSGVFLFARLLTRDFKLSALSALTYTGSACS